MIRSFRDKETEKVWRGEVSRKLPGDIQSTARRKLRMLHRARDIRDLRVPRKNKLQHFCDCRADDDRWSIRINDQWRICFSWDAGVADDVEICDYH